jgi:hypothetical protein
MCIVLARPWAGSIHIDARRRDILEKGPVARSKDRGAVSGRTEWEAHLHGLGKAPLDRLGQLRGRRVRDVRVMARTIVSASSDLLPMSMR